MSLILPKGIQTGFTRLIQPLIAFFTRAQVNPNWFTTLGLLLNCGAAASFSLGAMYGERRDLEYVGWAGLFILLGGLCDLLDGKVARATGLSTRFGALYDSVLDRYSEVIVLIGMGYYFIAQDYFYTSIFCFIALGGSTMVSYIRARSESLDLDCKVGLMQRAERVVWIGSGSLLCGASLWVIDPSWVWMYQGLPLFKPIYLLSIPIFMIAVLANFTSIQRMMHSYHASIRRDRAGVRPQSVAVHETTVV